MYLEMVYNEHESYGKIHILKSQAFGYDYISIQTSVKSFFLKCLSTFFNLAFI